MPHLTLEYSNNLGPENKLGELLGELHLMVGQTENVDIETVKSRMYGHSLYFVGAKTSRRAFLHLRLEILPGRTEAWKKELGEKLHALMAARAKSALPTAVNCSTTLEITELVQAHYHRTPVPPKA